MKDELLQGHNVDLHTQLKILEEIIMQNEIIKEVIDKAQYLGFQNYYIGAGCIAQTVWNYISGNPLNYGIEDIDFVYFDEENIRVESEEKVIKLIKKMYNGPMVNIDVKNQARVHLWYEKHFGYCIKPYISLEDAINTWPTTATAIGVRRELNYNMKVYAPFGLNDLFGKIVRPNKVQITKDIYETKVNKWIAKWPDLKAIDWDE